jgi:hypothetical protein
MVRIAVESVISLAVDGKRFLMDVDFTIGGERGHLRSEEVIRKLKRVEPEPIRLHAVEVGGRWFPMKQAFEVVTGRDRLDFTTNQARTLFKRLGFKVRRTAR